ncbi:acyl-CoA dehydrogenase family protein [Acuticoccus kandeliae]|uniref:acyl-CoA dehydrogenase family protein n=1 Tax=Acuticoccus kandeliae TaxID=2073160 RepID=UPI000D3EA9B9|nr:acyl-CoA dehydrogenase family protein [Acuticoccus kandeliae]
MDLSYTPAEKAFEAEVRAFLQAELPEALSRKVLSDASLTKADMEGWHAILNRRGWLATNWPTEYGGTGWSAVEKHIFEEECCLAGAPRIVPFGLKMLGPVLIKFGTAAQKAHYLPRILDGTDWWCQGYSEPGAGSDLAALSTRAVRDGDHYVVNGQKTWTTYAQHANWIFCLVRTATEGKKQAGISFLLIDMATPGIDVRPIRLLDGSREINEVFFDNVRVPVANLVGEENRGWDCAKYLLTHERTNIAGLGFAALGLEQVKDAARTMVRRGRPLIEDPVFAARIAEIEIDLEAVKLTNLRILAAVEAGGAPAAESSMLKVKGTVLRQAINDLARRALGPYAAPVLMDLDAGDNLEVRPEALGRRAEAYFNNRKISIYGGSNEIQKNIIAKHMLGL